MRAQPQVKLTGSFRLRDALHLGLELRIWVAFCVTILALFCARVSQTHALHPGNNGLPFHVFAVVFFSTLALYNLDGTLDAAVRAGGMGRRVHLALTAFSAMMLLWFARQLPPLALGFTFLGFILCAIYAVPLAWGGTPRALKAIPGIKGPFIGAAVATGVIWVPHLALVRPATPIVAVLTLVVGLYCTANAVLFDVPDRDIDERSGVPTIMLTRGLTGARRSCLSLCSAGILLWPLGLGVVGQSAISPSQLANLAALTCLGIVLTVASVRIQCTTPRSQVAWYVDGALLLPFVVQSLFGP